MTKDDVIKMLGGVVAQPAQDKLITVKEHGVTKYAHLLMVKCFNEEYDKHRRTTMEREALKLALEELTDRFSAGWHDGIRIRIDASDIMLLIDAAQALAQPEQEPVAWMYQHEETGRTAFIASWERKDGWKPSSPHMKLIGPLYTAPSKREWIDLTDEEAAWCQAPTTKETWKRIQAKLKEKNFD